MRFAGLVGWSLVGAAATSVCTWLWAPVDATASAAEQAAQSDAFVAPPEVVELKGPLQVQARFGQRVLPAGQSSSTQLLIEVSPEDRPGVDTSLPLDVALVIDRSGSMKGKRITQALSAARRLVSELRDGDRLTVIAYDVSAEQILAPTRIDVDGRRRAETALASIQTHGDTCISCGLESALGLLKSSVGSVPHVLLLSDGEANRGLTKLDDLRQLGVRAKLDNVSISSIGVDVDYDERVLSELAAASDGRHHFVKDATELASVFQKEFAELVTARALESELVLNLPEGVRVTQVYDRAVQQQGQTLRVPLGTFTAGDKKTLLLDLALDGAEPGELSQIGIDLSAKIPQGKSRVPLKSHLDVGVKFTDQEAQLTSMDPIVNERMQRTHTLGALRQAGEAYKDGNLGEAEKKLDSALAAVASAAAAPNADPEAKSRLKKQEQDIKKTKTGLRNARARACACAPEDLMCAMNCSAKPGSGEKAAAKRMEEVANPYSR
ncbi:MAG: VWA domain-containing protein [Polyangiaceae bacterium]|nr:VWA domain-containing protein [Myxococcales bacterium]MCB9589743.1 VWA domain-containing protein [Polyangiaceae bacterium]